MAAVCGGAALPPVEKLWRFCYRRQALLPESLDDDDDPESLPGLRQLPELPEDEPPPLDEPESPLDEPLEEDPESEA